MFGEVADARRKELAILRALEEAGAPLGARQIARRLEAEGVTLSERAIRYHLRMMDGRGLTRLVGRRRGRLITEAGRRELREALVQDRVGFVQARIELLAFETTLDPRRGRGLVPVNLSLMPAERLPEALRLMCPAFRAGWAVSDRVRLLREGSALGSLRVPPGWVGLVTVCSVAVNGVLLKRGVPLQSRFGGVLQVQAGRPLRFTELIEYSGSTLDPSEAFLRARMTSVGETSRSGSGRVLANYRELPAVCRPAVEELLGRLAEAGIGGLLALGEPGTPVCEVPVALGRVGMVLLGGLNPVACAVEAGLPVESHAMSALLEYGEMVSFFRLLEEMGIEG